MAHFLSGSELEKGERIVALELRITTGRVVAVNYIPADWSMAVDAGYSDRPSVSGSAAHGVGALPSTEELRGFVTVCDISSMPELGEPAFAVEGALVTTADFESTHKRAFGTTDLRLQEAF